MQLWFPEAGNDQDGGYYDGRYYDRRNHHEHPYGGCYGAYCPR